MQLRYFSCIVLLFVSSLSACSRFNGTPLENLLGGEQNIINLAYTIADDLEKRAYPPLIAEDPEQPLLTTTFVDGNDLEKTTSFCRLLQEQMSSRFAQSGYTVREIKLGKSLNIQPLHGETILSRNLAELRQTQQAQAIALGTYSISNRTLYITAKLVDPQTGNILSSGDYRIVMDDTLLAMFGYKRVPAEENNLIKEPRQSFMTWLLY